MIFEKLQAKRYLQSNPYRLKTKNINSLIFISTIIKYLMLMILLLYRLGVFKKERGLLYIDVILHKIIVSNKTLNNITCFDAQNKTDAFKML